MPQFSDFISNPPKNFFKIFKDPLFLSLFFFLIVIYFVTRLTNLTIIPVFADEAIYIRWAQVMRAESGLRFLPLSDGKQPLFMWTIIPFLKLIDDPLVAGRLVSVICGFGTMIGIFVLSLFLFKNKTIALFASLLYVFSPFALFFDRMALADGMLAFWGIWCLTFSVVLVYFIRLDLAMIAGIVLGLGLLTKSPALFFALLLPTTIIFSDRRTLRSLKIFKLLVFFGIVYLFGFSIYNILRLGPEFHMIAIRNKDYVFSFSEILRHPFNPLIGNLKGAISWLWILATPLIFISAIIGDFLIIKKQPKSAFFLNFWFLGPLILQSLIARVYTARYIFYLVPIFLILAAFFIESVFSSLKSKIFSTIILILLFFFPFYQIILLLKYPQNAWLPENERSGYFEAWTAGYGIKESAEYLKKIAKNKKVLVGTEGFFGTLPDGLQMYLEKVSNITVIGLGQPVREISSKLIDGLVDNRVFLLVNDSRFMIDKNDKLLLISSYPKALNPKNNKRESLLLFEVIK